MCIKINFTIFYILHLLLHTVLVENTFLLKRLNKTSSIYDSIPRSY